jgi:glutamate racemase
VGLDLFLKSLKTQKVGFFDSGIGGLSILTQCLWIKAKEFIYLADTKYLPYGNKTPEFLLERGIRITEYFLSQNISTIVIACHTSSATTLPLLEKLFPHVIFIDMLMPTIEMAQIKTKCNRIGIMATQTSIDSHVHKKLLLAQNSSVLVFEQACPKFVPLIEEQASEKKINTAIHEYLTPLLKKNIDTLILGCTHYAFLEAHIKKQAPHLELISAAGYLKEHAPTAIQKKPTIHLKTTQELERSLPFIDFFSSIHTIET